MKSEPGAPMTLGNAAAARVRLFECDGGPTRAPLEGPDRLKRVPIAERQLTLRQPSVLSQKFV